MKLIKSKLLKEVLQNSIAASLVFCLITSKSMASIPAKDKGAQLDLSLVSSSYNQYGIDISRIARVIPEEINSKDIEKVIPLNMLATNQMGTITSQIVDQSLRSVFASDSFKQTNLGKTSQKIEKTMQQDVGFGGAEPDSIQHKFKFNMQATQTQATIDYSGYTNAQLSYKAGAQELNLEWYRTLSENTKLAFNHIDTPIDSKNLVSLKMSW